MSLFSLHFTLHLIYQIFWSIKGCKNINENSTSFARDSEGKIATCMVDLCVAEEQLGFFFLYYCDYKGTVVLFENFKYFIIHFCVF